MRALPREIGTRAKGVAWPERGRLIASPRMHTHTNITYTQHTHAHTLTLAESCASLATRDRHASQRRRLARKREAYCQAHACTHIPALCTHKQHNHLLNLVRALPCEIGTQAKDQDGRRLARENEAYCQPMPAVHLAFRTVHLAN